MKQLFTLLLFVFLMNNIFAANYVVSGAGNSSVNGTYAESGTYNSKPQYRLGSTTYYLRYSGSRWEIFDTDYQTLYYTNVAGDTPPSSCWEVDYMAGSQPVR